MTAVVLTMGGLLLCAFVLGWEAGHSAGKRRGLEEARVRPLPRLKRPDDGGRP